MEGRRRKTLYDQMTAGNTSSGDSLADLFLNDVVLANQKTEAEVEAEAEVSHHLSQSRTLQDIIQEDAVVLTNNAKDRKSWKAFKDKLRLRRTNGSVWTSTVPIPIPIPIPIQNNNNNDNSVLSQSSPRNSVQAQTRLDSDASTQNNLPREQPNDDVQEDHDNSDLITPPVNALLAGGESPDAAEAAAAGAASMSLMDLLEETDGELGFEMDLCGMSIDDNDDVDVYEKEEEKKKSVVEYNCCVCMVRHKGAAFIPCGHTFCRMCSREIWVSRGNCPLCNNLISEVLDIF
ncbi:uncharacterized protein LOC133306431 [Gastrolobium bilobum]|uniref:uncharacterized protein LOC133306431 n=1 Tax=Gastrolobium bilobum TaxID=150636 RepID=UPI002AB11121|nr:uncharacterized protein LOC133306431 [Gastrolobium bilobum]